MSVTEAKGKYLEAKKAVGDCKRLISELQKKSDILEESLPGLTRAVEDAEKVKTEALDAFALSGNKQTEAALKAARAGFEDAQKKLAETQELVEATHRALKKRESEFPALQTQVDSLRHQVWASLFEAKASAIPESVRAAVRELICVGLNSNRGMHFILPEVFPLPTNTEIQKIYQRIATELNIE